MSSNSEINNTKFNNNETNNKEMKDSKKIFRFKLSDTVNDALALFTSANRFNGRKEIKTAWQEWCNTNTVLIQDETRRLENLGYSGDIINKMWTSVRYYHMKKENKTIDGVVDGTDATKNEEEKVSKRRKYITIDKSFLTLIDEHIKQNIKQETFKPAKSFEMFVNSYTDDIERIVNTVTDKGLSKDDFDTKLKKTYKNRYFNIVK